MSPFLWWPEGSFCYLGVPRHELRGILWACPGCSTLRTVYGRVRKNLFPIPAYVVRPTWGGNPGPKECDECGTVAVPLPEPPPVVEHLDRYEAKRLRIHLSTGRFGTDEHAALARKLRELEGLDKP